MTSKKIDENNLYIKNKIRMNKKLLIKFQYY